MRTRSRASLIIRSHNYPGFPEGIAGNDPLSPLRAQALRYSEKIIEATVASIARRQSGEFATDCDSQTLAAQAVVLALGVVDLDPELPNLRNAIRRGLIRRCRV